MYMHTHTHTNTHTHTHKHTHTHTFFLCLFTHSDNKEVAVKKKYGSNASMVPTGGGGGAQKQAPKGGKTGKGGKGIPKHEGTNIKFE
jgi:hypothetical protein